ncbi:MAG: hypothetical protein K8S54_14170 [Spirochaetia bacterium]|nr:hypothetical protein [Spirochaetia bacterium]
MIRNIVVIIILGLLTPSCMKAVCSATDVSCSAAGLLTAGILGSSPAPLPALPCQWGAGNASSFYTFLGAAGVPDLAKAVCSVRDGGFLVVGGAGNVAALQGKTPIFPYAGGASIDLFVVKLDAQGQTEWYTFIGSTGNDQGVAVTQKPDGSFVVGSQSNADIPTAGGKTPVNAFVAGNDFLLVQLSSTGALDWYTFLGDTGNNQIFGLTATPDGGVVAVGQSAADIPTMQGKTPINPYSGGQDGLATKVDGNGNLLWYTFFGSAAGNDQALAVTQAADSGIVISGQASLNVPTIQGLTPLNPFVSSTDAIVLKINSEGSFQWYTFFGGSSLDIAYSIVRTSDSGFIFTGQASANIPTMQGKTPINAYAGTNDYLVGKLNSSGSLDWYTFLGSGANDQATSVCEATDGGFLVGGYSPANIASMQGKTPLNPYVASNDYMIAKLNSLGSISWYTFLGGAGAELANAMAQTSSGEIVIAGSATANIGTIQGQTPLNAYGGGGNDEFVITMKSDGTL